MTKHPFTLTLIAGLTLAATAPAEMLRGVIIGVDLAKKEVVLDGRGRGVRGAAVSFSLSDKTEVLFGDQVGAPSDLETGRRVRIEYQFTDAGNMALVIRVIGGSRPATPLVPDVPPVPTDDGALTGVLRRVGYSDREVVLVGPGAKGAETETTIRVPPAVKIIKDGKEATLDDLKEGDGAAIQADKIDGRLAASSIQVGPGAAPLPPKRGGRFIPKLRNALQIVDQLLKGLDDRDRQP